MYLLGTDQVQHDSEYMEEERLKHIENVNVECIQSVIYSECNSKCHYSKGIHVILEMKSVASVNMYDGISQLVHAFLESKHDTQCSTSVL